MQSIATRLAQRMGVDRLVPVLVCTVADGPATLGWLRPVILLPSAAALGITASQLEAVLAHELAHILRHDYLVNVLQLLAETVCFYHPAVWWASHQLRLERERCCDDVTGNTCGDALGYARALTHIAKLRVTTAGVALGATSGPLAERIGRLLGEPAPRGSRWPALLAVSLVLATVLVDGTWIRVHAQDDATSVVSGLWESRPGLSADVVQLRLCHADEFSRDEVPVDRLEGFSSEWLDHDGPILFFTLRRDAGVFSFDGTTRNGVGGGTYRFEPSANFPADLARRGYEPPTSIQRATWPGLGSWLHTLAVYDIGLPVFDELRAAGVGRADYPRLVFGARLRGHLAEVEDRVRVSLARGWC